MASYRVSKQIDRSPEEVFEYISNHNNTPRWLPNVTRVDKITEGPVSIGTRFREARSTSGREGRVEIEVIEYDPPHRYSTAFNQGGYAATSHYTLKAENSGARVDLVFVLHGRGLKALLTPVVVFAMKRHDKYQLADLKEAIEEESQPESNG